EPHLVQLEVPGALAQHAQIPAEQVVNAKSAVVETIDITITAQLLAHTEGDNRRTGIYPVPQPREPQASIGPLGPEHELRHRSVNRSAHCTRCTTGTGRHQRARPEERVIVPTAVVLQVQLAQVSQRNGCVRAPHAEVAGGSIGAFPSKVPERSNADGPRVLRHTYSDVLEAVCIVLPRFISGSYPLSVHYLKCDVRSIPRRPYGHESTVVGKVRTRISHANSVRLVFVLLQ